MPPRGAVTKRAAFFLLLLAAACGGEAPPPNGQVDLPQPSGPPVAQQVDAPALPPAPEAVSGPAWESVAEPAGSTLRLVGGKGETLLTLACRGTPATLVAGAPSFKAIGSEDRFSLGLGTEPVTLVADPHRQARTGIVAEGAVPADLPRLLDQASQVTAAYGNQQVGPFPPPPEALRRKLGETCRS